MKWTDQLFHSSLAASFYDVITRQVFWRDAIAGMLEYVEHVPQHAKVLDLGCGPGISTFALASRIPQPGQLVGVDLSQEMVEIARDTHKQDWSHLKHLQFEQGDATNLRFGDQSFDLVFGHSFLYLVDDPVAVLREVKRVLKPQGQVVLMEPNGAGSLFQAARASQWLCGGLSVEELDK
jgi:ubiquinone/menaquinone biosynthesis C-methylase UbiE